MCIYIYVFFFCCQRTQDKHTRVKGWLRNRAVEAARSPRRSRAGSARGAWKAVSRHGAGEGGRSARRGFASA